MLTPTDQGDLVDIPNRQVGFFIDWAVEQNLDPFANETRLAYLEEVNAWNQEHGLTATCSNPNCRQGMRDDGRDVCSYACHIETTRNNTTATPNTKENHA